VDETAICNDLVIEDPISQYDDIPGIQWILGGVVKGDSTQFFVTLVPNRKHETLYKEFVKHIKPGSIIVSDGYPSYPKAVLNFGSKHETVNHGKGFTNEEGGHTNQIENLWSHLKQDLRKKSGLYPHRISNFLEEFSWRKRNCYYKNAFCTKQAFAKLILKCLN
jgi:transposase-like protein